MAASLILNSSICSSSSKKREITGAEFNLSNRAGNTLLSAIRPGEFSAGVEVLKFADEKQLSPVTVMRNFRRNECNDDVQKDLIKAKLYVLLEAVADRAEMHKNICDQRSNWNSLLLASTNALILAAATMAGIASISGSATAAPLKMGSAVMYIGATGLLSVVNKIQPSQLAEEQRNATRLFKQLQNQIQTIISIGNPTNFDVKGLMDKVLALDKAYPLPLLGSMLEKFPDHVEPAVWWPESRRNFPEENSGSSRGFNGWNQKLEEEMKEIVKVVEGKDKADYLRLGNKALKLNKFLATLAPVLTGLGAVGSLLMSSPACGGWAVVLGVVGGSLASVVNGFQHGGQVGMVLEMYRSNAGFFKLLGESIGGNLREDNLERRENGEVLEMKVGLQLGRSLSQLRELAASSSAKGDAIDEFASKLF